MTKKGQTSGLPKGHPAPVTKAAAKQPRLIKEFHTKAERDATVQRWLLLGTGIVIAVAVGLILIAVLASSAIPGQTAATVNGDVVTVGELQTEVRLERALRNLQLNQAVAQYRAFGITDDQIIQFLQSQPPYSTWISESSVPDQLGNTVLNQIIDNRLIASEAAARGISADSAAVEKRIEEYFGFDPAAALTTATPTSTPTASPTPLVSPTPTLTPTATVTPEFTAAPSVTPVASSTPTSTPNATEAAQQYTTLRTDYFAALRSQSGVGDAEITALFQREALASALRDSVTADLPREAPFVNARVIEVDTETKANDIVAALANGESFAELARANSSHASSANGGELDWLPLTEFATQFSTAAETALADAAPGAVVGPVLTDASTYVVFQVRGAERRTMTDDEYDQARNVAFETFLDGVREAAVIQRTDAWIGNVPLDPQLLIQ